MILRNLTGRTDVLDSWGRKESNATEQLGMLAGTHIETIQRHMPPDLSLLKAYSLSFVV